MTENGHAGQGLAQSPASPAMSTGGAGDDASSIGAKGKALSSTSGTPTQKLGRRGDPRMHRAVAARLGNPKLSLLEALQLGGFDINPSNDCGGEGVTLSQRKNQLSRRLRLARQNTENSRGPVAPRSNAGSGGVGTSENGEGASEDDINSKFNVQGGFRSSSSTAACGQKRRLSPSHNATNIASVSIETNGNGSGRNSASSLPSRRVSLSGSAGENPGAAGVTEDDNPPSIKSLTGGANAAAAGGASAAAFLDACSPMMGIMPEAAAAAAAAQVTGFNLSHHAANLGNLNNPRLLGWNFSGGAIAAAANGGNAGSMVGALKDASNAGGAASLGLDTGAAGAAGTAGGSESVYMNLLRAQHGKETVHAGQLLHGGGSSHFGNAAAAAHQAHAAIAAVGLPYNMKNAGVGSAGLGVSMMNMACQPNQAQHLASLLQQSRVGDNSIFNAHAASLNPRLVNSGLGQMALKSDDGSIGDAQQQGENEALLSALAQEKKKRRKLSEDASPSLHSKPQKVKETEPSHRSSDPTESASTESVSQHHTGGSPSHNAADPTTEAKMTAALGLYLADSGSLLKKCMLQAGFEFSETDESSRTYLQFAAVAVEAEKQRVQRLRRLIFGPSKDDENDNGTKAESSCSSGRSGCCSQASRMDLEMGSSCAQGNRGDKNEDGTDGNSSIDAVGRKSGVSVSGTVSGSPQQAQHHQHKHNSCGSGSGSGGGCCGSLAAAEKTADASGAESVFKALGVQDAGDLLSQNQNQNSNHNHSHSHGHEHTHMNGGGCCSSGKDEDDNKKCFNGRHVHRLKGECGHKAIIHRPEGGVPHVDFVLDGKVECYQNFNPTENGLDVSGYWPSKYQCDQLQCRTGDEEETHEVKCGVSCASGCMMPNFEPKEIDLSQIDVKGSEWNPGSADQVAALMSLGS